MGKVRVCGSQLGLNGRSSWLFGSNRLALPCCHVTGVVARQLAQHTRPNINMKDASVTTGHSTAARRV